MDAFERSLEKYAELVVKVGVNIQPGQLLVIEAELEAANIVRQTARKAYEAGAKYVHVIWYDDQVTRARFEAAADDTFDYFPEWIGDMMEQFAANGTALVQYRMPAPELYKGIDTSKVTAATRATIAVRKRFSAYTNSNRVSWCVAIAPTKAWAAKVYPDLPAEAGVEKLWGDFFKINRVDQENPVAAWQAHIGKLKEAQNLLNAKKYVRLYYKGPGTDLSVELPEGHIWIGGGSHNEKGDYFVPNMPTEEVFTMPKRGGVNGTLAGTKPFVVRSAGVVDKFALTFKDGRIVDYTAEVGLEHLTSLIETDEGSRYLGEIALVPHNSPISNMNTIFYNTILDENASCHFAIGNAYPINIENGTSMSKEELLARGANSSLRHEDFMIGSAELDIDGELPDGTIEPVFRKGNWAF